MIFLGNYILVNKTLTFKNDIKERELPTDLRTIYEVFRIEDGIALFLEDHLQRLFHGLSSFHISHSLKMEELQSDIYTLIDKNNLHNCNIKISCFCDQNSLDTYIAHFIPSRYPSKSMYQNGIKTILHQGVRKNPGIKIANTIVRKEANKDIEDMHVFEALLVNKEGSITEGSRSNVFFIKNNTIYSAPKKLVLPGIMRSMVINLILKNNIPFEEKCVQSSDLDQFDSAFITGTSPRILPIKTIEDTNFNPQHPLLKDLMDKLDSYIREYKVPHKVDSH